MAPIDEAGSPETVLSAPGLTIPAKRSIDRACSAFKSLVNGAESAKTRKLPECSTFKAAGVSCVVVDRLTNRQHPRGHVEELEAEVQWLNARVEELQLETSALQQELSKADSPRTSQSTHRTPLSDGSHSMMAPSADAKNDDTNNVNVNVIAQSVTSNDRFVSESSGLFFGNIVQSFLLEADYKGQQGPKPNPLRLPTGNVKDIFDGISTTCIDVGNPCVFVQASDIGVEGGILADAIESHLTLLARLDSTRRQASVAIGISKDEASAPGSIPKTSIVSSPHPHSLLSGEQVGEGFCDLVVRSISVGQLH